MRAVLRDRIAGLDVDELVGEARAFFLAQPRTFGELRDHLMKLHPKGDERAMGFVARMSLPLVQVPTAPGENEWGYPADPAFAHSEAWLGAALSATTDAPDELSVLRHFAAFGPATVRRASLVGQGLRPVQPPARRARHVERKRERSMPRRAAPAGGYARARAPLAGFDNLIVSRADRGSCPRAPEEGLSLRAPRARDVLVDGFAAGTWSVAKKAGTATVTEPFAGLPGR